MRALRRGWNHVIDDRTYVFHDRSKSFGESKTDLMAAGRAIIDERYLEYTQAISVFRNSSAIALARMTGHRAAQALLSGQTNQTRVLFVIATQTGGTPQTNADLMRAFDGNIEGWSLRCDSHMLELCRLDGDSHTIIATHVLEEPVNPVTHLSFEYERVVQHWILTYDFDLVHIRHIAWHSLNLPAIAKKLNRRVVFSFHDFYVLTPTIKMIDDAGVYLGNHFEPEGRMRREGLWPLGSQPDPTGSWIAFWRSRNAEMLSHCDAFITTSDSARALILQHMPDLPADRFLVIPHGRDFSAFARLHEPYLHYDETIRILLPGNIDSAKGLNIIFDLLDHDTAGRIEFHILGKINLKSHPNHPRLFLHGQYQRDEFADRVAQIKAHAGAVLSIWDETYCHTLTEMWSVGLPVIVLDMPNVASRVRGSGGGWIVDHKDISVLYETILNTVCDPREQIEKVMAVAKWQTGYGAAYGTRMMAAFYLAVYRDLLRDPDRVPGTGTRARIAVVCPAHRNQKVANASTFIRIWERCRNDIDRDITFIRMTAESAHAASELGLIDAAIIQRTALPRQLVSVLLKTFRKSNIPYLFSIDDDLLNVPKEKDPKGIYKGYASTLRQLLSEAKVVTVSTEPLRKAIAPFAKQVDLLPNRLSNRLWTEAPGTLRRHENVIRALYLGTLTHDDDLGMILPALDAIAAKNDRFRCALIGVSADQNLLAGREEWLEQIEIPSEAKSYDKFVPWLLRHAPQFDFAIAPLTDTPFNELKSSLKLYDYAGMGLPVLVSDVSTYRNLARTCPQVELIANTTEAWEIALQARLKLGARMPEVDTAQHDWLHAEGMLQTSLPAFDAVLMDMMA